jgi:hypothetical protein
MPAIAESKNTVLSTTTEPFTESEAWTLFDQTARQYMGVSGKDFLRLWDDSGPNLGPQAMRVAILIPMIRKTSARQESR